MNKAKIKENLPFILFVVFLIIIHYRIHLVTGSDDDFMSTAIKTGNLRQLHANNRIVLNFFGAFIMSFPLIVWKILNIAVIVFLITRISKYTSVLNPCSPESNNSALNWGICFLFFLLPFNVLSSGVFWVTGSFNYLWGICGSLFIGLVFVKDMAGLPVKNIELLIGLLWGIYACDVEQPMVIVCFSGIAYLIYCFRNRIKIRKAMLFYGLVLIVECMPIIFLPFNASRSVGEQRSLFPNFMMLSFFDKIYQGAMYYYNHLVNQLAFLFFLIALFAVILVFKNTKSKLFHMIAMLPMLYFLFAFIIPITSLYVLSELIGENYIYNFSKRLFYFDMAEISLLPFFFATFNFILLFFILFYVLREKYQKYTFAFLYFAAFADGMMMSFAPSIYVSGNRVFFAPDILFLTITSILGKTALTDVNITASARKIFSCIAFCSMLLMAFVIGEMQSYGIYY